VAAAELFGTLDAERHGSVRRFDVLALGVGRTSKESAELGELVRHRRAALLADFVGLFGRVELDRPVFLAREVAGEFAFRITRTRGELAVAAPFDNERLAALRTRKIGLDDFALDVAHLDLRAIEIGTERRVETPGRVEPATLSLFDFVELVFETRGEFGVEDVRNGLDEK